MEAYYLINRRRKSFSGLDASTVILFHPQTLGIKNSIKIIRESGEVFFYVLDNFFFCKKSYNCLDNSNKACLVCLKNKNGSIENNCPSFPNKYSHSEYIAFIDVLEQNLEKIVFLTQNEKQADLLKLKFGDALKAVKVGMFTGEFSLEQEQMTNKAFKYDILYHNTLWPAKGIRYFIDLCKHLPQFSFVVPYTKDDVERILKQSIDDQNIHFIPCNWSSGLEELVEVSRINLVPSLWSAPIEGSLLKSLYYASAVATIIQDYSFSSELPEDICIRLSPDIESSARVLSEALSGSISLRTKANDWIRKFSRENTRLLEDFIRSIAN